MVDTGYMYLKCYAKLAKLALDEKQCLFMMKPKIHYWCEIVFKLQKFIDAGCAHMINPLAESVELDEDWIGRVARLSKAVSPRLLERRSTERVLTASVHALDMPAKRRRKRRKLKPVIKRPSKR